MMNFCVIMKFSQREEKTFLQIDIRTIILERSGYDWRREDRNNRE